LRQIRFRLGITTRDVDQISRKIAEQENNPDYMISHARLVQIETGESTPSIYKIFTLSAIYGIKMSDILSLYVRVERISGHHMAAGLQNTHLLDVESVRSSLEFPIRFDPAFNPLHTNLISRMVEVWGEVPVALLHELSLRKSMWGVIGLNDYTMFPLLRPGSLVQIEHANRQTAQTAHRSEYERPIYFVELRDGYICSWCEIRRDRLICIPHPLSPVGIREYAHPQEAEIVGQVTAVAARLVNSKQDGARAATASR
jgi:transcriptional regulator with XRE-family HTH domain